MAQIKKRKEQKRPCWFRIQTVVRHEDIYTNTALTGKRLGPCALAPKMGKRGGCRSIQVVRMDFTWKIRVIKTLITLILITRIRMNSGLLHQARDGFIFCDTDEELKTERGRVCVCVCVWIRTSPAHTLRAGGAYTIHDSRRRRRAEMYLSFDVKLS